ncbi:hypothetical protein AQPE_4161 [Aquipluma nitroreducens]|uniref:Uncharacterized protein n=1 Tax=Aquipluma nitroreducens TaxID=2010828 RepID=A0A5K7SEG5_9BACT|nr:hypothetical protein AQPE_4161 [Aquipluma nitroreducens]
MKDCFNIQSNYKIQKAGFTGLFCLVMKCRKFNFNLVILNMKR